jgi:hypothetical protein
MYSYCICSPETGIVLFVNQREYVHSEPPVIIPTVVVVVDIAARRQCFRAASLLPRMTSANDGRGGEPTRRSAVQSPSPPDRDDVLVPSSFCIAPPTATAVIGGRHRSLVIVPFSRTVAIIVLVLLLPPERTPIPDRDSRPRRATYDDDGRQHRRRNSRHILRPLEVACVRTSVLPSFYALYDFFPVGIPMIVQPRRRRSDSPPADPDPDGGDAATPEGSNSAKPLSRGDSNSSPTPSGISAAPPVVVVDVVAAVVIIFVVDETPVSTSSLRVGRPMTRGPVDVDVAAGAAAAELFDFRSVTPPRGWWRGHRHEWSLLLPLPRLGGKSRQRRRRRRSHHLEETTTTKAVASFRGDEGEDEERMTSFNHHASATRRRKVRPLVAAGHGGRRRRGFWFLVWRIIGVHGLGP